MIAMLMPQGNRAARAAQRPSPEQLKMTKLDATIFADVALKRECAQWR
jgi:hypothetical protein